MTAREWAAIARRHYRLLVLAALAPLAGAVTAQLHATHQSIATAKLLYIDERALSGATATRFATPKSVAELLSSEREMLTTPSLAGELARQFGPDALVSGLSASADESEIDRAILSHLRVEPVYGTSVLQLWFTAPTPKVAKDALSYLVRRHMERRLAAFGGNSDAASPASMRLDAILAEEAAYKAAHNAFDPDAERQTLVRSRNDITGESYRLRGQIAEAQAKLDDLKEQFARAPVKVEAPPSDPAALDNDEALDAARGHLRELRAKQREVSARGNGGAAELKSIGEQIEALASFVRGREAQSQNRGHRGRTRDEIGDEITATQAELRPLQARLVALEAQLAEVSSQLKSAEEASLRIAEFERARADAEAEMHRQPGAPVAPSASQGRLEPYLIQEPIAIGARRGIGLATSALLGAAGGVLLAAATLLGLRLGRRTCVLPESLEHRYGMPVLTSLPIRTSLQ